MTLAYTSMASIFIAKGYTFLSMTSEVIGAILSIVMFKIMINKYNFYGAAWGQVISYFLIFIIGILLYFLYKKIFNKPIKR